MKNNDFKAIHVFFYYLISIQIQTKLQHFYSEKPLESNGTSFIAIA